MTMTAEELRELASRHPIEILARVLSLTTEVDVLRAENEELRADALGRDDGFEFWYQNGH